LECQRISVILIHTLAEVGFINSDRDNEIFDNEFQEIINSIAAGLEEGIFKNEGGFANQYGVQVGLFRYNSNAQYLQEKLEDLGYFARVRRENQFFSVVVGEVPTLEMASMLQLQLQDYGYVTMLVNA
jgi:N-acetylmuramoyl-L-alanine amidase